MNAKYNEIINKPINITPVDCLLCGEKGINNINQSVKPSLIEYQCPKCCFVRIKANEIIYTMNKHPYLNYLDDCDRRELEAYFKLCCEKDIKPKILSQQTKAELKEEFYKMINEH